MDIHWLEDVASSIDIRTAKLRPRRRTGPVCQSTKESNDANDLKDTAKAFKDRYSDSTWAKKASISSLNGER